MIWPVLLLLTTPVFAQIDLSAIKALDEELPSFSDHKQSPEEIKFQRQHRRYLPPTRIISLEKIQASGTQLGAIKKGSLVRRLENNQNFEVSRLIYVKVFNLEDEHGFKYIQNKDGSVGYRVRSQYVEPIKEELALYEPPTRYTPAPDNIVRTVYDKKLTIPPEVSFYMGTVRGDYMADLFEDNQARSGTSNQYGLHFFTQWKLPVKAGGVVHYERTSYNLAAGGKILYSSPSIGPQVKTKEFEIFKQPIRFQTQIRISPLARATAETQFGSGTFKFNSTDLLASLERPIKNRLGEFVLGLYYQAQWLNIREQQVPVSLKASNETNKSFGLSFAQVFE